MKWCGFLSNNYFSGKHMLLFIVPVLILLIGLVYTILLFLWQWLLLLPRWRILSVKGSKTSNSCTKLSHTLHFQAWYQNKRHDYHYYYNLCAQAYRLRLMQTAQHCSNSWAGGSLLIKAHYKRSTLAYYSKNSAYYSCFLCLLFPKLCWHIRRRPSFLQDWVNKSW